MNLKTPLRFLAFLASFSPLRAADIEISQPLTLSESNSLWWVRTNLIAKDQKQWDWKLDEAKWGTPSGEQGGEYNWDWKINDAQWRAAVAEKGEGKKQECTFDLWIPEGAPVVKGMVVMSGHGSGSALYKNPQLRQIARELQLGLLKFIGDPVQRGFWPKSLLAERLKAMGLEAGHPEIEHAPVFLYGHSNGTGFSAIYPATEGSRVWGWVSMRPGVTFQVYQPGGAQVPGMVIFGEDDHFLGRPSKPENLAVVELMRSKHNALWHYAVEPHTGHGPGEKTWPLVFSFLRHSWAARVPADADPRKGPVPLRALLPEQGYLGQNWDLATGGYQKLPVAPFASFPGDKSRASWLLNAAFAADWQKFQETGQIQ